MSHFSSSSFEEFGDSADFSQLFGPGQVDQFIRQAIRICWMALPKDKKNVDEVERQIRRIMERALDNLRVDGEAFKRPEPD
jgi:hypothetical protein